MLTDKANNDFEKWFRENKEVNFDFFNRNNKALNNFVIFYSTIEWLYEIGVYVNAISYDGGKYWKPICNNSLDEKFSTRHEALKSAILQANELYNE